MFVKLGVSFYGFTTNSSVVVPSDTPFASVRPMVRFDVPRVAFELGRSVRLS